MAVKEKPQSPSKNMSLSERLKLQAASGVEGTMDFISSTQNKLEVPKADENSRTETVVPEQVIQNVTEQRTETVAVQTEKVDGRTTRRKSGKFVDKFTFSFPEEEKLEFKAFAAAHGISITDLIMYSLDYLKDDVENGKINIFRYGVKRLG